MWDLKDTNVGVCVLLENLRKKESVVLELARGRVSKFLLVGSNRLLVV